MDKVVRISIDLVPWKLQRSRATEAMWPTGLGWLDAVAHTSVRARTPIEAVSYPAKTMTANVH